MSYNDSNQTESTGPRESSKTVRATWDGSGLPSTSVLETIATANELDPLELPCLYEILDVEALDSLLTSDSAETRGNVSVSFTYEGTHVWIDSAGTIEIEPDA